MKLQFFLLTCLAASMCFSQTVVIAKKTKNAIYIGADSKSRFIYRNARTWKMDTTDRLMCKFQLGKNINFAFIGNYADSAKIIAQQVSNMDKPFSELVDIYIRMFVNRLVKELTILKRVDPLQFDDLIKKDTLAQTFIFANADSLRLIAVQFVIMREHLPIVAVNALPIESFDYLAAGYIASIENELDKTNLWLGDIPKTINRLIQVCIKNVPWHVGGPINILKFTKKGVEWLQKKPPCF